MNYLLRYPCTSLLLLAPVVLAAIVKFVEICCRGTFALKRALCTARHCAVVLRRYAPEVVGVIALAMLTAGLIYCSRNDANVLSYDLLIVIQGMLRVVLVASVILRAGGEMTALSNEPSAFFLLSALCRIYLFGISSCVSYHVIGPLGGWIAVIVEVIAVPFLLYLCRGLMFKGEALGVASVGSVALAMRLVASRNCLKLADDANAHLDTMYSNVQLLELCGACAFIGRTYLMNGTLQSKASAGNASAAYVLLIIQQAVAADLFFMGFAPPLEAPARLVRAGHPFEMLWSISCAQLAMYVAAAICHIAVVANGDVEYQSLEFASHDNQDVELASNSKA